MSRTLSRRDFSLFANVSRETIEKLDIYEALLRKWNKAINIVAQSTLDDLWSRHFIDSAQLLRHTRKERGHWVDLGTGGGFPGLVIATISDGNNRQFRFTFVESDLRKAAFLRTVIRELDLDAKVVVARIESTDPLAADVLSARALAPMNRLLEYTFRHLEPDGQALFLKGKSFREEMTEALEIWAFSSDEYPSATEDSAVVISIGNLTRV